MENNLYFTITFYYIFIFIYINFLFIFYYTITFAIIGKYLVMLYVAVQLSYAKVHIHGDITGYC